MKNFFALTVCLILTAHMAHALRASRIESAAVTPPGQFTFEFDHRANFLTNNARTQLETARGSLGMGNNQQIDVIIPWQIENTTSAENVEFGDMGLFYKTGVIGGSQDGRVLIGAFANTTFPTSEVSRAAGNNYRFESSILITQAYETATVNLNAGSVVQTDGAEMMRYGIGFEKAWSRVGIFAELLGFTDFSDNGANEILSGAGGIEVALGERFSIDVGGEGGITSDAPDWSVFGGASMRF